MDGKAGRFDLQQLQTALQNVQNSILSYRPISDIPPILDSSFSFSRDERNDGDWLQMEQISGLNKLRDCIQADMDALEMYHENPSCSDIPPILANAPYLIAVWNEVLCVSGSGSVEAIFKSVSPNNPPTELQVRKAQRPQLVNVDVIGDYGRHWVRINTIKNSRLLAEFREIDSYLADSDDSSNGDSVSVFRNPTQMEFDNSILRMGRSLLAAAKANPIEGIGYIPRVSIRLTRLDPSSTRENDPRIAKTVGMLREMGIDVYLGERSEEELLKLQAPPAISLSTPVEPTLDINLDLSVLIALVSDISHAPLPNTVEAAEKRYIPYQGSLELKQKRIHQKIPAHAGGFPTEGLEKQSRALSNQLLHEMGRGLLREIYDRIASIISINNSDSKVKFWTTVEARDRCLRIVSKIGGLGEKRRAHAMFFSVSTICPKILSQSAAEEEFWRGSRYPSQFLSLLPVNILSVSSIPTPHTSPSHSSRILSKTCKYILDQGIIPDPRTLSQERLVGNNILHEALDIERANVTKANTRLTEHTVQSLLWGAELGWTTLTTNRSSIKAILREIKLSRLRDRLDSSCESVQLGSKRMAVIWVVDPKSLAEGMSNSHRD